MKYFICLASGLALVSCGNGAVSVDETSERTLPTRVSVAALSVLFDEASLLMPITEVDCTLSGGTKSTCLSITLKPEPAMFKIGPWCPRNISDGPELAGIWLEGGKVYDADGAFIQNMSAFYEDKAWQLFDPATGKINITDSKVSCAAAARPDVDPMYQNHCVECQVSYMEEGASQTYIIPLRPVPAMKIEDRIGRAGVGVAFSGVRLDAPAPTDAILSAHTLAPFDDCGGHVNLNAGYHMHAVTEKAGCHKMVASTIDHASQIGLAMDGYAIYARLNLNGQEPSDLDACRGHDVDGLAYHYHANDPGANAILTCHTGETGCAQGSSADECRADLAVTRRGPPPGGRPPPPGR